MQRLHRRLWIIEKPWWMLAHQTVNLWRVIRKTQVWVLWIMNRDLFSIVTLCFYIVAAPYGTWLLLPTLVIWFGPGGASGVIYCGSILLQALVASILVRNKKVLRWLSCSLATPLWLPLLVVSLGLLITVALVMFAASLLLLPLGALATLAGMAYSRRRSRQGIKLRCVHGDCKSAMSPFRDLEIQYVCLCGNRYSYLIPSHRGFRHHHCTCGAKLITSAAGRLQISADGKITEHSMAKYCPRGHRWGQGSDPLPAHFIAIVGAALAGKTTYITMAVREMLRGAAQSPPAFFESEEDKVEHDRIVKLLDAGRSPSYRTQRGVPSAAVLRLPVGNPTDERLYLYDASGEDCTEMDLDFRFFDDLTGIILMADPQTFPTLRGLIPELEVPTTSGAQLSNVVSSLQSYISRFLRYGPSGRSDIPLAVVISKADLEIVDERVGPRAIAAEARNRRLSTAEAHEIERRLCRKALCDWGMVKEINALESSFRRIDYFAASALGRMPEANDIRPFRSDRVLPPLLWLLKDKVAASGRQSDVMITATGAR